MRILVTNHHLAERCGSETFTGTLVEELARRGHDVDVFAFVLGAVSADIARHARIVSLAELRRRAYDLALVSHRSCQLALEGVAPLIRTCHGVQHELEQPAPGAAAIVSVSEEVAAHVRSAGYETSIIRNGVDCARFRPTRPLSPDLGRVLLLSNYEAAEAIVAAACDTLGVAFRRVGGAHRVANVEEAINEADLVVTLGRGVYESLACGRNVVVFDRRDYDAVQGADGFLCAETLDHALTCNCSGRAYGYEWDVSDVADALRRYDPALCEAHRALALDRFDVSKQLDRYLEVACALPA